jgi:glycosidase
MKQFGGDEKSYKVAAATLLTLPGTPFVYYGEEIGLGMSEGAGNEDQTIRGPMSWSAEPQAGFTKAAKPYRPNVSNWKTHNVAAEQAAPDSLLSWYRGLIALRNAEPALSVGSMTTLTERDATIFAFTREHEGSRLLVLINFAYRESTLTLPAGFQADGWTVAFPSGAALPFAAAKKGNAAKPGTEAAQVKLAAQQVVVLKAR